MGGSYLRFGDPIAQGFFFLSVLCIVIMHLAFYPAVRLLENS